VTSDSSQPSYPNRFLKPEVAEDYVQSEYGTDSYSTAIWNLQVPLVKTVLAQIHRDHPGGRHLDFACGTGRITRLTEEIFPEIDALDISPAMVDLARATSSNAQFFVGNILENSQLCSGPYTSATTFRLLLNLDPPLRVPILKALHSRLQPDGVIVLNVHGNRQSLRQPAILWKRWRRGKKTPQDDLMLNDMSPQESRECLETAGFSVQQIYGTGVLPPSLYRWPLRSLWRKMDAWLSGFDFLTPFCIDLIFVCKRKGSPT
jgi:SAM-dependent methyltransferase